jgi:predicted dehydrogenase
MNSKIKWGIIGPGKIAHKFAHDLLLSERSVLQGVASRNSDKAKQFSEQYHAITYFDSYEALAQDPNIDVVYIATPHPFHFENTMMCFQYGKHVLCEKPMGMSAMQVNTMIHEAATKRLFLMEGMWTRFIPATLKVLELLKSGAIGDLQSIRADFGFLGDVNPEGRLYNKKLGGGSLLDIGIYPIYLSLLTLGLPANITAIARWTDTEVDSFCAMLFDYENSAKAILDSSIEADTPIEANLYGSKGAIKMHNRWHHSEKISWYQQGELKETFELPFTGNGYYHEIEEVNSCLLENKLESEKLPLKMSIDLITTLDRVREKIGLRYSD